jgi:vacuolar-type H+-ATPase subunit I/STV1
MSDGTVVPDDEDLMAAALAELRTDRVDPPAAPAPAPAESPAPAPAPAVETNDAAAAPAASTEAAAPAADAAAKDDPQETLRKTQEELQKARSELGRVGQLNRHLADARTQLAQIARENEQLKKTVSTTKATELTAAAADKLAALDAKAKEFPELADIIGSIKEALVSVDEKAASIAKQTAAQAVEPLTQMRAEHNVRQQAEQAAAYEKEMAAFEATYPTAVQVLKTPDFQAWIATAPRHVQEAFRSDISPGEAMAVMDAYDAALRRAGKAPIANLQTALQTPAPAPAATQKDQNAARLKAAAGLPSRNSGAKGGMPPEDDFEGSLDFFRRQRLAKAA